jgi:hypothetical protein
MVIKMFMHDPCSIEERSMAIIEESLPGLGELPGLRKTINIHLLFADQEVTLK